MKACRFTVELSSDDARKRGELFKRFAEFINAHPEWWDELNVFFTHGDGAAAEEEQLKQELTEAFQLVKKSSGA